jgi:hypothetical protein
MNFFYEISDAVVDEIGCKYIASYNIPDDGWRYNKMIMRSDRVWIEHPDGRAYFLKHRWKDCTNTPVDLKELFWIKLKSEIL